MDPPLQTRAASGECGGSKRFAYAADFFLLLMSSFVHVECWEIYVRPGQDVRKSQDVPGNYVSNSSLGVSIAVASHSAESTQCVGLLLNLLNKTMFIQSDSLFIPK